MSGNGSNGDAFLVLVADLIGLADANFSIWDNNYTPGRIIGEALNYYILHKQTDKILYRKEISLEASFGTLIKLLLRRSIHHLSHDDACG